MPSYTGAGNCITTTLNSSGIKGFYKGCSAALFRQATYSSVKMYVYESYKKVMFTDAKPGFLLKLCGGGLAGAIGKMKK